MNTAAKIFGFLLIIASSLSCSEEVEPKPYTYTQIFTGEESKTWKVTDVVITREGQDPRDYLQFWNSCERDDRYTFFNNVERKFQITNGVRACDEEEDLLVDYNWSFVNSSALLNIPFPRVFGNFVIPFTVGSVTEDNLTLFIYLDNENQVSMEVKMEAINE